MRNPRQPKLPNPPGSLGGLRAAEIGGIYQTDAYRTVTSSSEYDAEDKTPVRRYDDGYRIFRERRYWYSVSEWPRVRIVVTQRPLCVSPQPMGPLVTAPMHAGCFTDRADEEPPTPPLGPMMSNPVQVAGMLFEGQRAADSRPVVVSTAEAALGAMRWSMLR